MMLRFKPKLSEKLEILIVVEAPFCKLSREYAIIAIIVEEVTEKSMFLRSLYIYVKSST